MNSSTDSPRTSGSGNYQDLLQHQAPGERERLQLLATANDPRTFDRLDGFDLPATGRFLDLGSGLGTVGRWLAEQHPSAQVVATDLDIGFLNEQPLPNLTPIQHDATTEEFPAGSFDLIYSRMLLTNLPSRETDLMRIIRWLAPGGLLVLEEANTARLPEVEHPACRTLMLGSEAAAEQVISFNGHWSTNFPEPLRAAGLIDCGVAAGPAEARGGDPWTIFWRESCLRVVEPMIERGAVTPDDAHDALAALLDPEFSTVLPQLITTWGRRPAPA